MSDQLIFVLGFIAGEWFLLIAGMVIFKYYHTRHKKHLKDVEYWHAEKAKDKDGNYI